MTRKVILVLSIILCLGLVSIPAIYAHILNSPITKFRKSVELSHKVDWVNYHEVGYVEALLHAGRTAFPNLYTPKPPDYYPKSPHLVAVTKDRSRYIISYSGRYLSPRCRIITYLPRSFSDPETNAYYSDKHGRWSIPVSLEFLTLEYESSDN